MGCTLKEPWLLAKHQYGKFWHDEAICPISYHRDCGFKWSSQESGLSINQYLGNGNDSHPKSGWLHQTNTYIRKTFSAIDYEQEETGWSRDLLVEEEPTQCTLYPALYNPKNLIWKKNKG